jgi:hypothetical protein
MYELWLYYTLIIMPKFKPTVSYRDNNGSNISLTVKTYAEVKRRMKAFMNDSFDENVNVYRSRRGEWGEWFEHWSKVGSKCQIIKEGWQ